MIKPSEFQYFSMLTSQSVQNEFTINKIDVSKKAIDAVKIFQFLSSSGDIIYILKMPN